MKEMLLTITLLVASGTHLHAEDALTIERRGEDGRVAGRTIEEFAKAGYLPVFVRGYVEGGIFKMDTVYVKAPGCPFEVRNALTDEDFRQKDRNLSDLGFTRISYHSYNDGPRIFHAAIWHKR